MIIRDAVYNAVRQPIDGVGGLEQRFAYNLDGIDDRFVLANRAINPDGDIDIEFQTGPVVPAAGGTEYTVLSQCLTATFANKEFILYFNSSVGALQMQVGGTYSASSASVALSPNTTYRALLRGTGLQFFKNGQSLLSTSFTRGTAREPTAKTVIGANTHGAPTTFRALARGIFYNIKINGTLWPMADRNQAIQLPEPSGLGAELITQSVLEAPALKDSQWFYLGEGRWSYVGDGSLNQLRFITASSQPAQGYVEFEIESISGSLACTDNLIAASIFDTAGVKRYFYTDKTTIGSICFKRSIGGQVFSCIIKNISFKPLGTCNPMTGANLNPDRWVEIPK